LAWRLRARFFELAAQLRPEVLDDLLRLDALYQRDWPRPIVTPIYAHSAWTQVLDPLPAWLEDWTRKYNIGGSTAQWWVEKTALFTLRHYLGRGHKTPTGRRRFEVPCLTPLPAEEDQASDDREYEPKPFRWDFPPIDQTDPDWHWRRHLQGTALRKASGLPVGHVSAAWRLRSKTHVVG
jgi:hypothetical protein